MTSAARLSTLGYTSVAAPSLVVQIYPLVSPHPELKCGNSTQGSPFENFNVFSSEILEQRVAWADVDELQ